MNMDMDQGEEPAGQTPFQGRYEILSKAGAGGFGTVFKARQTATGQLVAVKLLRLGGREGEAAAKRVARFEREMRLCARLHHTNIVGLIDSGKTEEGQLYLVFAFVPGKTLKEVLEEEGALEPIEARHLMLQVLDALASAHAQGIIHRDLKPSNIMVMPTGARRNALVLDFGIGALIEDTATSEEAHEAHITSEHEVLGTPAYAAPEQLRGLVATPRADLFSWGLVLLECMTGRAVFSGRLAEVFAMQLSPEPIPIPAALRDHPLGRLLSRVLVKDAGARNVTAQGLMRELESCDLSGLRRGILAAQAPTPRAATGPEAGAGEAAVVGLAPSGVRRRLVEPAEGEGERRLLTAVCCSFGVSGAGETLTDIEDRDEALRMLQELCIEAARRSQATIAGVLGDRALLYFGYPVAHEDDAERAARLALEIATKVVEQNARAEAENRLTMDVRLGVHTGLVVIPELREASVLGASFLVGTTASTAAHLSSLARPGAVLISGETYRLLRSQFVAESLGVQALGGGPRPIAVYRVKGERSASATLDTVSVELPVVGRSYELALMAQRWARVREGFGQSILITGEPGIGKSRLALELRRIVHEEVHLSIECRCALEHQNSALHPIIEALAQATDLGRASTPEEKVAKLEVFLTEHGFALKETMPLLAPLFSLSPADRGASLDVPPQRRRELTLTHLVSLLIEAAERRPVLLLVEDLQWADPTTLELIGLLLGEVSSASLCLLLSARPEFSPPWPLSGTLQIRLGHLEKAHVEDMIASIAGGRHLPGEVIEHLVRQADGVPLFVEELTRTVLESGALTVGDDGRYKLDRSLPELFIPSTLHGSLMARLDRLGRARETAQIAAALGREFSAEVLAAVSPLGEAAVLEDLGRLTTADIVYLRRRARQSTYGFKHALVRDAAYESLSRRARRRVHARIASTLEERFPEVVAANPGLLALHHAGAEQKREAIQYAQTAAQRALHRSMNEEAIGYARQAISWLGALKDPRERAEVELGLNAILIPALMAARGWGTGEVEAAIQRSQELGESAGGGEQHALTSLWALVDYHLERGRAEQVLGLARRYHALSERAGDSLHTVASLVALGDVYITMGRLRDSQDAMERAIALYDPGRHRQSVVVFGYDLSVFARATLGYVLWLRGCLDRSTSELRSSLARAEELEHAHSIGLSLLYLASVYYCWRDREAVQGTTQRLEAHAARYGLIVPLNVAVLLRAWVDGDVPRAERAFAALKAAGSVRGLPKNGSTIAESEMALGRLDAALARLDGCVRIAEANQESYYLAELYRLRGDCLLARGDTHEAKRCLGDALALARSQDARTFELRASVRLARILLHEGRGDEARELLDRALDGFVEGEGWSELAAARALHRDLGAPRSAA